MNAIFLGGESARNQAWIHQVSGVLGQNFQTFYTHDYQHWADGNSMINIEHELKTLETVALEMSDYMVFAKSIGTVLSVKALARGTIKPKLGFFVGIPLGYITRSYNEYAEELEHSRLPVWVCQNKQDPAGSYEAVNHYLSTTVTNGQVHLTELSGNTHSYEDIVTIDKMIKHILSTN